MSAKVFVIGFHKTGTTSLGKALRVLGYRVGRTDWKAKLSDRPVPLTQSGLADLAIGEAAGADAFEDNPWPMVFRELDAAFPGSKFILTRRDPGAWLRSVNEHFGTRESTMRGFIYGADAAAPFGNETRYLCRYQQHIDDVLQYFAGRPDDLLVIDIASAEWGPLCRFLGHKVPSRAFPHANPAGARGRRRWYHLFTKRA